MLTGAYGSHSAKHLEGMRLPTADLRSTQFFGFAANIAAMGSGEQRNVSGFQQGWQVLHSDYGYVGRIPSLRALNYYKLISNIIVKITSAKYHASNSRALPLLVSIC